MKLNSPARAWNKFFFEPQSCIPIALFRIVYGALVAVTLLLLRPDWLAWYGSRAWLSLSTAQQLEPGWRLNLFAIIPQKDDWIEALFWLLLVSAFLLSIGFLTRLNTLIVFLGLTSIHQRNLYITHGGDAFLRVAGFFLIFAPAGAALSADYLIRRRFRKEVEPLPVRSPWAQRMIQYQLAILYFAAFCWKLKGAPWIDGTALYYVYHLDEIRRFPVPSWLLIPIVLKLGTWAALALEFSLGVLIWVRKLRYYILAAGLLFHLCIEYSLNVPLFEWDVLSGYILFIDEGDFVRLWNRIQAVGRAFSRTSPGPPAPALPSAVRRSLPQRPN